MSLDSRPCPKSVDVVGGVTSKSFVEGDEESGVLSPKDGAVQDQGNELAEIVVSSRDRAIVHVVTHVRGEPHVV